jgi:hypothetical protein
MPNEEPINATDFTVNHKPTFSTTMQELLLWIATQPEMVRGKKKVMIVALDLYA